MFAWWIELMKPSNHFILCWPLLLSPSVFPSIRVFSSESALCIKWPNIGPSASILQQSIEHSASVLPMNIQDWFPLGLTGLISLLSKELSRVFSNTTVNKYKFFGAQPSLWSNSHICTWLMEKPSDQISRSVLSDSLPPHELQHARPPCPLPTPGVHSDSHPSSQWCHPAISSSAIPFSSCLQSFPASGSFPVRQLFSSGGQSIGASASASVLPVNIQDWFPLGLTGLISLQCKGLSRIFSNTTIQKHQFFGTQLSS